MWKGNNKIFKTYVRGQSSGDGKRPAEKVKDRDSISTFDEVKDCDCFGGLLQKDVIDISFDTKELYEAFLEMAEANDWKCLCLPSKKGGHTYWKNTQKFIKSGADKHLAVGLIADIHKGSTYIPLCVHGEKRFPPDYDIFEDEDYQEVPEELLPVNTNIDLWQLKNGNGRNENLFKYILLLQAQLRLPEETIRQVLTNANKFVFAESLSDSELEVIMRDESFNKPVFFDDKTFLFDLFAKYLLQKVNVKRINGQLHVYKDGAYIPGTLDIEKAMIDEIPYLRKTQRKEVLEYLQLIVEDGIAADPRFIAFNNGVLDIVTDTMSPFTPDMIITNKIPWNYNPDAYSEVADETLNNIACGDKSIRALLEECIGLCFYRRNEGIRKAFILTGGKRGGKSTFLDCIKTILGDDNISSLDLKEVGDRFSTALMAGKLANIGDDLDDDFLMGSQVAMFKKIVAGNRIKAERKGQDPFEFNPYVKLLFSCNDIPRMRDRSGAALDRLIIIPFNATFDKSQPNYRPFLKFELIEQDSIEYLIKVGIEGLKRILAEDGGFTKSSKVQKQLAEYEEENNPVLAFCKEVDVEEEIYNQPTKEVYRRYTMYCQTNGFTAVGHKVFSKQVNILVGTVTKQVRVNNQRTMVFEKG